LSHLIFDGTFLYRRTSIVALSDATTHTIVAGKFGISESAQQQLTSFLQPLKDQGLNPRSCTLDGNPNVIRTFRALWPTIAIQRCIVHVQRQGLMWCRHRPKRNDARHLRQLFLDLPTISTIDERDCWIARVFDWDARYGQRLLQHPQSGWVSSDLVRARSMLLKALPNLFLYLDDPNVPKTTNGLEGYFSRLKQHYRQHRGLARKKLDNYFLWYFYFRPR
jgi:hypothetical protein